MQGKAHCVGLLEVDRDLAAVGAGDFAGDAEAQADTVDFAGVGAVRSEKSFEEMGLRCLTEPG